VKPKKIFSSIITIVLLLVGGQNIFAKSIGPDQFEYYKEIQHKGKGLRFIAIDPEIYDRTNNSASDIRIFDSEGTEVQYHKYRGFSEEENVYSEFDIINRSDSNGMIQATFVRDSSLEVYNSLRIEVYGENYLLSPQMYGSQNGIDFYPIQSRGYIYSFDDGNRGSNQVITFDKVNYKYINAEFEIVMGYVSSEDILSGAYIETLSYMPIEKPIEPEVVSISHIHKTTEILLDMKYKNLPISNIVVNANNENYNREVKVFTSDDMKDFEFITSAHISSFDIENYKVENKEIVIQEPCFRYIKLVIINEDNEPLDIQHIESFYQPDILIFESNADKDYRLYYGNRAVKAPVYDIAYIADKINKKALKESKLGPMIKNPDYKQQDIPFTERNNHIITLSIALMVVVLGFIVVKNLKDK